MLDIENTTIICIDMQEKLVKMLENGDEIAKNATKLMQASSILNINTLITEQYPKGLGETIKEISNISDFKKYEKTSFSFLRDWTDIKLNKNIVIFGIETHICVYQSVLNLLQKGYKVYVIEDCCSSRNKKNHKTALKLMQNFGAKISTLEIVLFEFLKTSKHEKFKEIQNLIK